MPSNATSSATKAHMTMKAATVTQAAALALGLDDVDVNRLTLALTIAAADEVEENTRFASRVQTVYAMLPASKSRTAAGSPRGSLPKALTVNLKPIKRVEGGEINPLAPLDPYLLLEVYGAQQLRLALDLYSVAKLREGVAAILERHPGPKPPAKATKAALIEYIATRLSGDA